jgi:hypothetical protein
VINAATMNNAVVDDSSYLTRKRVWILGCAPDTCHAEFTAPTLIAVVRTVNFAPAMAATRYHSPALRLCVSQSLLNLFLGMRVARHQLISSM